MRACICSKTVVKPYHSKILHYTPVFLNFSSPDRPISKFDHTHAHAHTHFHYVIPKRVLKHICFLRCLNFYNCLGHLPRELQIMLIFWNAKPWHQLWSLFKLFNYFSYTQIIFFRATKKGNMCFNITCWSIFYFIFLLPESLFRQICCNNIYIFYTLLQHLVHYNVIFYFPGISGKLQSLWRTVEVWAEAICNCSTFTKMILQSQWNDSD